MKTKTILFLFLLISGMMSAQAKRVAILETVDKENQITYANKLILRSNLSKAITNTEGYEAYDRTDIDAIMGEQNFQRTGMVSNDQIKRLGEMTGANYILVAEAVVIDATTMFITAKLLDVETAQTILTDNIMMGTTPKAIQDGCISLANKLFKDKTTEMSNKLSSIFSAKSKKEKVTGNQETNSTIENDNIALIQRNSKTDQKLFGVGEYTYNGTQMDKKALQNFLKNNSPEAYKKHMVGTSCIKAGWSLFGIGLASTITGGVLMGLSHDYGGSYDGGGYYGDDYYGDDYYGDDYYDDSYSGGDYGYGYSEPQPMHSVGVGLLSAGCSMIGISVPLLVSGYVVRDNAYKKYNVAPKQKNQLTLNLKGSSSGIGLALNF